MEIAEEEIKFQDRKFTVHKYFLCFENYNVKINHTMVFL